MPMEADVAVVRRFFGAVAAGDLAAAGDCFREDATWHVPGTSRIAGTHRGWPGIRDDFLAKLAPSAGGRFERRSSTWRWGPSTP
jgi:ketosteroid isomerase-like protein